MSAYRSKPAVSSMISGTGWVALFDIKSDAQGRVVSGIAMPVVMFGYRWSSSGVESVAVFISGEYDIVDASEDDCFGGVVPADAVPPCYQYRVIVSESDDGTPAAPSSVTTG